jgi:hypothetical protein
VSTARLGCTVSINASASAREKCVGCGVYRIEDVVALYKWADAFLEYSPQFIEFTAGLRVVLEQSAKRSKVFREANRCWWTKILKPLLLVRKEAPDGICNPDPHLGAAVGA